MVHHDVPAMVTIERGTRRLRCVVVDWTDEAIRCEPYRAGPQSAAFLVPRSAVVVTWSTESALLTVEGTIQGRPDGGVVTVALTGPVTSVQRRDTVRARCVFPCEVAIAEPGGVRTVRAETIDLSATGVGVRGALFAEPGTAVAVAIFPSDDELPLLAGRVVSAVEENSRYGIAFGSVLPADRDRVASLVARRLTTRVAR
jgi:c-di-GMP-binding flagellar brake protein YcgR